jgi:Nucleotide modification associated domain 3
MRLILSRKGYDSSSGGVQSPIFPDGGLCSLPIPEAQGPPLEAVQYRGQSLRPIVEQLTGTPGRGLAPSHPDPDLDARARPRRTGWLPAFGQVGAAQSHLANRGVGEGDLFLFFGWFREVEHHDGRLHYRPQAPNIHCLFGWLQVGRIYRVGASDVELPAWTHDHPHVAHADRYDPADNNTLYVAAERLLVPGVGVKAKGGGVFGSFRPELQLTEPGCPRSMWRLPACFHPGPGRPALSYHSNPQRWRSDAGGVLLQTVARGQEFVLDCDAYPGVSDWLGGIFAAVPSAAPRRQWP